MKTPTKFYCEACGRKVTVSGGLDWGFVAVVRTMICQHCKDLVDVLVGQFGQEGPTGNPAYDKDLGLCPNCRGDQLTQLPEPTPCPKCGGEMKQERTGILWD